MFRYWRSGEIDRPLFGVVAALAVPSGAKTSKRPKKNVATKRLIGTTYERLMSITWISVITLM